MTGVSLWQLLILFIVMAAIVLVFGAVVKKAGFSRWWSLLMLVPLINLIMIWVFAFVKWPAEKNA